MLRVPLRPSCRDGQLEESAQRSAFYLGLEVAVECREQLLVRLFCAVLPASGLQNRARPASNDARVFLPGPRGKELITGLTSESSWAGTHKKTTTEDYQES